MANVKGGAIIQAQTAKTEVIKRNKTMKDLIVSMEGQIAKALPSVITPERFTRMVMTALSSTPKLQECTPKSFLGAMMQAAQLGVEPNTPLGQAYLIPYSNHGNLECQFQLGYKGLLDLAYRSGDIADISAHVVYANDKFEYELGLTPKLRHVPALTDRGESILYYAIYHTKSGGYGFEVMSREDVVSHRNKYSKAAAKGFSPWATNFDEMAKKTVLKRVLKYAPLKSDFQRAVTTDETIKSNVSEDMASVADERVIEAEAVDVTDIPENVNPETGEIVEDINPAAMEEALKENYDK